MFKETEACVEQVPSDDNDEEEIPEPDSPAGEIITHKKLYNRLFKR